LEGDQQIESLFARRRVAHVIHVEQHRVVVAALERGERRRRRVDGVDVVTAALQQQPKRFQHIGLVVRDQDVGFAVLSHRPGN